MRRRSLEQRRFSETVRGGLKIKRRRVSRKRRIVKIYYIALFTATKRDELQDAEVKYAEVKTWLNALIEQTMKADTLTQVDSTTMKILVDRIIVKNEGIEVEFKCGVSIEKEYKR